MTEQENQVRELAGDAIELLINVGIIDSIADRWPDEVRDEWMSKIWSISEFMRRQIGEIQEFASAWDDRRE